MEGKPIIIFNRYSGKTEEEVVFGERVLRFSCETKTGRLLTSTLIARPFVSRTFGWYMSRSFTARKVTPFIEEYGINASEFKKPAAAFTSFNDFFTRELLPGARPIDPHPRSIVFPADGRHLGWQELGREERIYIKGQKWNLAALLGHRSDLVEQFSGGTLVLSRLCPVDYHHFHFPLGGRLQAVDHLPGPLYSVNPISLRSRIRTLWENRRCLNLVASREAGLYAFLEIGATNVGSIHHLVDLSDMQAEKGDRKGWFSFGGSSVVTLFQPGSVRLCEDLLEQTTAGIELFAKVGDRMGEIS